jgi:solute carrier family 6 amino acid transporter-like protein 5/7/9/14
MVAVRINESNQIYCIYIYDTGAFIIPYFCIYFLVGTPLYFLELSLGQFTSSGPSVAFKMSRMFRGIHRNVVVIYEMMMTFILS